MNVRTLTRSAVIAAALILMFPRLSSYLDFTVGYWHPSRVLLEGKNPYAFCDLACLGSSIDAPSLRRLNPVGMNVMYNPAVFPLFFPWAVLPFQAAALTYSFCFFFFVSLTFQILAEKFTAGQKVSSDGYLIFWFSAVPLGLLLQSVLWGSPSWMALVGVVMFSILFGKRPFVAGLFLSLTLIKIHLFLIFGVAVFACCLRMRNWLTPLGFAVAASVSLFSALFFRSDILSIYAGIAGGGQAFAYVNATVPSVGRSLFHLSGSMYLLGPSVLLGILTFTYFWFSDRSQLTQKLFCVLPFSIGFAPYAWGHDYICAVPVLVIAAAYVVDSTKDLTRRKLMGLYLFGLNVFALFLAVNATTSPVLQLTYGIGLMVIGVVAFRISCRGGSRRPPRRGFSSVSRWTSSHASVAQTVTLWPRAGSPYCGSNMLRSVRGIRLRNLTGLPFFSAG
jgi:hypothetical protein